MNKVVIYVIAGIVVIGGVLGAMYFVMQRTSENARHNDSGYGGGSGTVRTTEE